MSRLTGTMRSLEMLGKFHGGIAAYGMADNGDWLGVATVIADCLIGDTLRHIRWELMFAATPVRLMRPAS
jgi:hypothetical protein